MANSQQNLGLTYKNMLDLTNNIINISNTTIFMGVVTSCSNLNVKNIFYTDNILSVTSNLYNYNKTYINNYCNIGNNIKANTSIIKGNFTIVSNLNANYGNLDNVTMNSNLNIDGNIYFNNITVESTLCNSSISYFNYITTYGYIYISHNANLNNTTINSQLMISGTTTINNTSFLSNLYISGNTIIQKDVTVCSNLYIFGSANLNNKVTIVSNLATSSLTNINNSVTMNNITILSDLSVFGSFNCINCSIGNISMVGLPEYPNNSAAANGGIPLWGYYRTGDILKIRTDVISPILTLSGPSLITISKGQPYIDPGVFVTDNLNENILPYITNIQYNSTNYLSNQILLSNSTTITSFNTSLVGNHIITYTAIDSYGNYNNITRTVTIQLNLTSPTITLVGSNLIKIPINTTYTDPGVIITDYLNSNLSPIITGSVNINQAGKYLLTYTAIDLSGNAKSVTRTVYVLYTQTIQGYNFDTPSNTYLYISGNYTVLAKTQYWTIETWVFFTSFASNGCTIIDFRSKPFVSNIGSFAILVNSSGYIGIYNGTTTVSTYLSSTVSLLKLNKWSHIACQRNGINIEFYIDGTFAGQISCGIYYDETSLTNLYQITLGMANNQLDTSSSYHLKGKLSHVKISLGLQYNIAFIPKNDLTPLQSELNNTLFFLTDNYLDLISGITMSYLTLPVIENRQNYINLVPNNITINNLIFNLQVSNLPNTNISWVDTTNNYSFIMHPNANNFNSISKIQNNNGWRRSGYAAWIMNTSSFNNFKSVAWENGLTLEQWIYIDFDFIPSQSTNMLLVGQSSLFSSYDYGFCFSQSNYSYSTYPYNVLAFSTNILLQNQTTGAGSINLNTLRGKWSHLAITISSSSSGSIKTLNLYLNGGLVILLDNTTWLHWPNPALSSNYFSIGCNSNNGVIQAESLNSIHYGNTRMYNRLLFQDEIINNYYYELLNYIIPTSNIYFITKPPIIESLTVPNYDLTAGYLTQNIDLNILRSSSFWTIEVWVYATSWGANDSNWIIDFNYSGNNTSFFSIGITTNITGISPSITYDGNGRPFIYYANDTIMQWKIKNNVVPLYQWVHLAYQKNSDTELQIFMNGNTLGTFTINANEWKFPSFSASGINNILIGGSVNNPSSTTKHWKGQMSQLKISLIKKYKTNFTPQFDLSINDFGIFLLHDNYTNYASGKSLTINNSPILYNTIPTTAPKLILNGSSTMTLFKNIDSYIELGSNIQYNLRTKQINYSIIGIPNTSTIGLYSIKYIAIDIFNNVGYIKRYINVITYNIPPVIKLIGSSVLYLPINGSYTELGVIITNNLNETIIPNISGTVNVNSIGQYIIIYTAIDSYGNSSSIQRIINIIISTSPLSNVYFWLDPSITTNITFNNSNTIVNVLDISGNNIYMVPYVGQPTILPNTINTLSVFNFSNSSSLRSSNTYPNSTNVTLALIVSFLQNTSNGCIWGHFSNRNTDISLVNPTSQNLISWRTNSNTSVGIPYIANIPVMIIGILYNGISRYLKMINLNTGQEFVISGTNTLSLNLSNNYIYLGSSDSTTELALCYIGECLYWKRVLTSNEIYIIENYLYNKWSNNINNLVFTTLLPTLTLNGPSPYYLQLNENYIERGYTITNILYPYLVSIISLTYNNSILGNYTLTYTITDSMNNTASINRIITVVEKNPPITFNTINGNLQLINLNFNSMNNTNWTCEIWLFMIATNGNTAIFDFRQPNNGNANLPPTHFWLEINNSKPIIQSTSNTNLIGSTITQTIPLNKWTHVVWMRNNNIFYTFINGIPSPGEPVPTYLNNLNNLQYLVNGAYANTVYNNSTTGHFNGLLCQPLVMLTAKYNVSGFIPNWDLTPTSMTNILFWLKYDYEIISNQIIILNRTVTTNTLLNNPIVPILKSKTDTDFYIVNGQNYIEYGAIATTYLTNNILIPYISSILNNNTEQLLTFINISAPPIIINQNIINTSTINQYTITYTTTDSQNLTSSIIKNVYIVSEIPIITYNTTNGWMGPINSNYNSISNTDWTIEVWVNITSYSANYSYIIDTRIPNNTTTSAWAGQFALAITSTGYLVLFIGSTNTYTSNLSQIPVPLNTWTHLVYMRKNNLLYTFINGIISTSISVPINLNTITTSNNLSLGCSVNQPTNTNFILKGQLSQLLIILSAKYNTINFTPKWILRPSDMVNILFWLENSVDIISNTIIPFNNTILFTRLFLPPILPSLVLNGNLTTYVFFGNTYTDLGVTVNYVLGTLTPYIISIKNLNGIESISQPINASGSTLISNALLYTSTDTSYIITYSVIDPYGRTATTIRNVLISSHFVPWDVSMIFDSYRYEWSFRQPIIITNSPNTWEWGEISNYEKQDGMGNNPAIWGLSLSYRSSIGFTYNSNWCFVLKFAATYLDRFPRDTAVGVWFNIAWVYINSTVWHIRDAGFSFNFTESDFPNFKPVIKTGAYMVIYYNYDTKVLQFQLLDLNGNIYTNQIVNSFIITSTSSNSFPFAIFNKGHTLKYYDGIYYSTSFADYATFSPYFNSSNINTNHS